MVAADGGVVGSGGGGLRGAGMQVLQSVLALGRLGGLDFA